MRQALTLAVVASIAVSACGSAGEDGFTLREIDGVVHADNVGPGAWADAADDVLSFELEQTFGADEEPAEAILGSVHDFAVDDDGRVYVLDSQAHRILAFEPDGTLAWTTGRKGEGPGDLMNPVSIAPDGKSSLYVINDSGTRLDQYDLTGVWHRGFALADLGLDRAYVVGFAPPHEAVLQSYVRGAAAMSLHRFRVRESGPWEVIGPIEIESDPPLSFSPTLSAGLGIGISRTEILVGNTGRYLIRVVGIDGTTRHRITRDFDRLSPPLWWDEGGRAGMITAGELHAPLRLKSGHLLVASSWATNIDDREELIRELATAPFLAAQARLREIEYANAIDLFSPDGRYLASLTGTGLDPEIGRRLYVASDGALYATRSDPYPQVRRYRVVINEPS